MAASFEPLTEDQGVTKQIRVAGTGTETPPNGAKVRVHYTGRLHEGDRKQFDSSVGREPFQFDLGKGE